MLELFKQLQTQQGVGFLIATHDDLVLDTAAHVLELTNQSLKTASG
jgi:ABC-type lipoprotein export system ATPase subunit